MYEENKKIMKLWTDRIHKQYCTVIDNSIEKEASDMNEELESFFKNYEEWKDCFQKTADPLSWALGAAGDVVEKGMEYGSKLLPYILFTIPAVAGGGVGYLAGMATDPTKKDFEKINKAMYAQNLKMKLARIKRREALDKLKTSDTKSDTRSIRI